MFSVLGRYLASTKKNDVNANGPFTKELRETCTFAIKYAMKTPDLEELSKGGEAFRRVSTLANAWQKRAYDVDVCEGDEHRTELLPPLQSPTVYLRNLLKDETHYVHTFDVFHGVAVCGPEGKSVTITLSIRNCLYRFVLSPVHGGVEIMYFLPFTLLQCMTDDPIHVRFSEDVRVSFIGRLFEDKILRGRKRLHLLPKPSDWLFNGNKYRFVHHRWNLFIQYWVPYRINHCVTERSDLGKPAIELPFTTAGWPKKRGSFRIFDNDRGTVECRIALNAWCLTETGDILMEDS